MTLIIDIPKELKQKIDEGFTNQVIINKLWDATRNGIPLEQIRDEIEELQQDVLKSSETPLDSAYNISIGISMALGVIKKYTKGEQE